LRTGRKYVKKKRKKTKSDMNSARRGMLEIIFDKKEGLRWGGTRKDGILK
jgi:hypothetical protein